MHDSENDSLTLGLVSLLFWYYSHIPTLKTCKKNLFFFCCFQRETKVNWSGECFNFHMNFYWFFKLLTAGGKTTTKSNQIHLSGWKGSAEKPKYSVLLLCVSDKCLSVSFSHCLSSDQKSLFEHCCERILGIFHWTC